ncbi:MAG: PQQ-dependent sugar dehydrogenase, partial [Planctomycetes bacterium]|nr:PQQ-dependent sugar dehydrogenase [Planctomycetota bacterium]
MNKIVAGVAACILPLAAGASQAQTFRGVETKPHPSVVVERAFPNLKLTRPVVLTHAGDGSGRLFACVQQGLIQVFPNRQDVTAGDVETFLDLRRKVVYKEKENEEGLLGMAFHPKYAENGEFFLYYTTTDEPHTSVISRFRVSADDPNRADPNFEEEVLRIPQPFWNHNGGTIVFGPDGYLYVGLGDGGAANDPHGNGQNLETLLGSILRIDIDSKDPGLSYAIPKDNPFVGRPNARGEIWAYGLRNVWRMDFDQKTSVLWAADVGQNLWEEINLIVRGGNYGWNVREAAHPFVPKDGAAVNGGRPRPDMIDPVWEYHHDLGKSITGGNVYRGKKAPQLAGMYVYADYVSGLVWALDYDYQSKQVRANYLIPPSESLSLKNMPVITFGEDEEG